MKFAELMAKTAAQQASYGVSRFSSLENAKSAAENSVSPQFILLSEDGKYIVTTGRIAQQMEKAGYEFAA